MGFGQADFPGQAGVMHAAHGRRARAALAPGNQDAPGAGLGRPAGNGAHPAGGDQLDGHPGAFVGALQVVDQLGQILDGIDIVVGRGRDQGRCV